MCLCSIMTFSTTIACCSFMSKHSAIFSNWTKIVIVFDEGDRLELRLFASPMCLRCHSISDFGCHLGVDGKCLNIILPAVYWWHGNKPMFSRKQIDWLAQLWCFSQPIELPSGVWNCDTYIRLGHWAGLMRWMLIIRSCWAMKSCYYD